MVYWRLHRETPPTKKLDNDRISSSGSCRLGIGGSISRERERGGRIENRGAPSLRNSSEKLD